MPLRLLGHPVHAMVSDLPVALLGSSLVWDVAALVRGEGIWWTIGFWNVALGLAGAAVAAIAGLVDFSGIADDHPASRTARIHMYVALGAVGLYIGSLVARGAPATPAQPEGWRLAVILALDITGVVLLGAAGWLGGHLVFHYGVGRTEKDEG
jgi:uncharacterized membrane protein